MVRTRKFLSKIVSDDSRIFISQSTNPKLANPSEALATCNRRIIDIAIQIFGLIADVGPSRDRINSSTVHKLLLRRHPRIRRETLRCLAYSLLGLIILLIVNG